MSVSWPDDFVDPWLSGPAFDETDSPAVRELVQAGLGGDVDPCPAQCDGGLLPVPSLVDPTKSVTVTCPVCKGTGEAA